MVDSLDLCFRAVIVSETRTCSPPTLFRTTMEEGDCKNKRVGISESWVGLPISLLFQLTKLGQVIVTRRHLELGGMFRALSEGQYIILLTLSSSVRIGELSRKPWPQEETGH